MADIDALIAEVRAHAIDLSTHGAVFRNDVYRLLDALTAERAKVAALEAEAKDAREMFEGLMRTHTDNVREYDKLKKTHADHVDYLCRDQADLRDKLSDAKAEAARWREAAKELAVELNRIADVTERWTYNLASQVNEIARAALARFKQESGQ